MSISQDDIIQIATGSFNATTGNATLPAGTTDGNTIIVCVAGAASVNPSITGFTRAHGTTTGSVRPYILYKSQATAGETSWTITGFAVATPVVWVAMEIQNLSKLNPVETWANPAASNQSGTSLASATTLNPSYSYETLGFVWFAGQNTASSTVPTFSSITGNFLALVSGTVSRVDGATALAGQLALNMGVDIGNYQSTATASVSVVGNATIMIFNSDTARRVPNLDLISGAEQGTAAGRATGVASGPVTDATNGTVNVVTTSPRTGTYCWELSGTSAAANIAWTSTGALSLYPPAQGFTNFRQYVARFAFYFPTSLPGADVTLAAIDNGTDLGGAGCLIKYRTASQKIGVTVAETSVLVGTEVLSSATVSAGAWHTIDIYLDMTNRAREQKYHAYWRLDDVDQTEATVTTSTTSVVSTFTQFRLGWQSSTTATVRYDDVATSKHPGHFPLGDIRIYPIAVDPAATPAVTTAANFSTFTANGTLNATFSTTTARDAVKEIPPLIGATSTGFVQDTIGATDYVEMAMNTRDAATNLEAIRGLRWYFCGWANAAGPTTAATIGFRGYDGTTETTLFAAAEPNFTNSTTTPSWVCRMHRTPSSATPYQWTQAGLDALTARVGFSSDATPVVGVHAIMAELACRAAFVQQVVEQDGVLIYGLLDPDSGNVIGYRLDATNSGAAWADYVVNGVTVHRTAAAGAIDTYVIGAESNSVVTSVSGGLQ